MTASWSDLVIENLAAADQIRWLQAWGIDGRVAVLFLNRVGCWFLAREDGSVDMLNVFSGTLEAVAESVSALQLQTQQPEWRKQYLVEDLVAELRSAGKCLGPGQCYAVAPPPVMGGPNPLLGEKVNPRFVTVANVGVWQSICIQALAAARSKRTS